MISERIFSFLHTTSTEGFAFAEKYVDNKTYSQIKELLNGLLAQFKLVKKDQASVTAKVADYAIFHNVLKEFIKILPEATSKPSEFIKDKNLLYKTIGTMINTCAHNDHIAFDKGKVLLKEEIPDTSTDLKKSAWNDPEKLVTVLRDRLAVDNDMMTNLSAMKENSEENKVSQQKIEDLCTSVHDATMELTEKFIWALMAFTNAYADSAKERDIEITDYLATWNKLKK